MYLRRDHPFFSFSGWSTNDINNLNEIAVNENAPAYVLFQFNDEVESLLPIRDKYDKCHYQDSDNLEKFLTHSIEPLCFLDTNIETDAEDLCFFVSSRLLMLSSKNDVEFVDVINKYFLQALKTFSPVDISGFLDIQFEIFKKYPKNETISNFFLYLEGLMDEFKEPQKIFVLEWIKMQRRNPLEEKLPTLAEIFKEKGYYTFIMNHEKVKEIYTQDRINDKYILKSGKKEMLAALAIKLREKQKLIIDPRFNNNQFLARIFFNHFNVQFDIKKGDKAFQPSNYRTIEKKSNFSFITDF